MAKPSLVEVDEIPVFAPPPPERVAQIEGALRQLEQGIFGSAAQLVDAMMRDDRIAGCLETRINGLLGARLCLKPGKDTARGRKIAEDLESDWGRMFDTSQLADIMRWGVMVNAAPVEILWKRTSGWWDVDRLKVWHPYYLYFESMKRRYLLLANGGTQIEVTSGDGKWAIYSPFGSDRAWNGGLVRSLAHKWLMRQWGYRDAARWCEVNGSPIIAIKYPSNDLSHAQRVQQSVARRGADMSVLLSQTDKNGVSYGLEMVQASGDGFDGISSLIEKAESAIAIRILGQKMSTEGQSGLGSQENGGDSVRNDIKRADSERLGDFLRENVLKPWALYNFGDADLAPWPQWEVEPPEDTAKKATELKALAEGLKVFVDMGATAPLDMRTFLEEWGLPLLTEAEVAPLEPTAPAPVDPQGPPPETENAKQVVITPSDVGIIVTVNEGRASMGLGPIEDGHLTIAEYKAKHEAIVAAAANADAGSPSGDAQNHAASPVDAVDTANAGHASSASNGDAAPNTDSQAETNNG